MNAAFNFLLYDLRRPNQRGSARREMLYRCSAALRAH
jgi:hypothetical protein